MKLRGAAKQKFLARMARGRARRARNPAHQLQLGGGLVNMHGEPVWSSGRAAPKSAAKPEGWFQKFFPPEPAPMYDHPKESPHRQRARWKREREAYAPQESPARKRARAKREAKAKALRAWIRKFGKGKPFRKAKPKKATHKKKAAQRGKLSGKAKAAFLRKMAAGRRKAKPHKKAKRGKLTGKAKAAFLRRMAAGRGKWRTHSKAYVYAAQHRKGVKKHLHALKTIGPRSKIAGLVRINPKTGAITMTKVANPKKRRRRARNPSFGGVIQTVKSSVGPMFLGGLGGLGAGVLDAKLLHDKPTTSILAKLSLAFLGGGLLGKRHPMAAAGFAGGLIGSIGYQQGVKLGGGMVGLNPSGALKGIADMAADNPEMAATLAGLGDIVEGGGQIGDASDEYSAAMADAGEDMGDIVEAE